MRSSAPELGDQRVVDGARKRPTLSWARCQSTATMFAHRKPNRGPRTAACDDAGG